MRYAVVTCPSCRKSFVISTRWTKAVRCRYCGRRIKVDLSRRVWFEDLEMAKRAAGLGGAGSCRG